MRNPVQHQRNPEAVLQHVLELLKKAEVMDVLASHQETPRQDLVQALVKRQNITALQQRLNSLHPADVAYVLESLPLEPRQVIWDLLKVEHAGAILLEVSDAVRENLIADMTSSELVGVARHLDSDDIAELVTDLPKDVVLEVLNTLDSESRSDVQSMLAFPEDSVGALMDYDLVTVREDINLDVVLRYLRRQKEHLGNSEQIFVVNREGTLRGSLALKDLLFHDPEELVIEVMNQEPFFFYTDDDAKEAASAFERYDLISAPVVNNHKQLVGRLTIDTMLDFTKEVAQKELLNQAGLSEEEDIFASIYKSAKNRWAWLAINLVTAFIASRVIGAFENTIEKLVALATLMPIIAGIGGNSGNQIITLIIRGLALKQVHVDNIWYLLRKELSIAIINGLLWGAVMGVIAVLLYNQLSLGIVMMAAMTLNLLVAAFVGVFVPLIIYKLGRDPVFGSNVILTALTDSLGFFIFLGLASVFLL